MQDDLITRVQVLETRMDFTENTSHKDIKVDLRALKQNQFKMFERFSVVEQRFSAVQAHLDNKFLRIEERISNLQSHSDERITSIHQSITTQTRWIMLIVLGAATLVPVLFRYL